jgi:hypothetical protein
MVPVVRVRLQGSATLQASLRETGFGEFETQIVDLAAYPRTGDEIVRPDGAVTYTVKRLVWVIGAECPLVVLG